MTAVLHPKSSTTWVLDEPSEECTAFLLTVISEDAEVLSQTSGGSDLWIQQPFFSHFVFYETVLSFIKCVVLTGSPCGLSQLPVGYRKRREGREEISHRAFKGAIPLT